MGLSVLIVSSCQTYGVRLSKCDRVSGVSNPGFGWNIFFATKMMCQGGPLAESEVPFSQRMGKTG